LNLPDLAERTPGPRSGFYFGQIGKIQRLTPDLKHPDLIRAPRDPNVSAPIRALFCLDHQFEIRALLGLSQLQFGSERQDGIPRRIPP